MCGKYGPNVRARVCTYLRALVLLAFFAAVSPGVSVAADDFSDAPVEITADHLEYEAKTQLFTATGHVRIVNGARSIDADWVVIGRESERGIANGGVVYRDGGEELFSEFLQFDVQSLQGLIYQAELDTGNGGYRVEADQLIRTGKKTYTVRAGRFTTCRCEDGETEPWVIDAGEANVRLGGYATAQNTTIEVLGVPVVWLPWVIFPVKTERETGVLFPEFGFRSDAGFETGLPLFWAARKNLNVTATPVYMTERGYKQNIELEYLLGKRSKGKIFGAYGRDQARADSPTRGAGGDENRVNRWTLLAKHEQWLPGGWQAKADIRLMSDNNYADDYVELTKFRHDLFLDSTAFVFRHFGDDGRLGIVGSAIHTNDIQALDSRDRDSFIHHQLPSLRAEVLSGRSTYVDGLVTRFEFDYSNFYADQLPQDKFNGDDVNLRGKDLFLDIGVDALPFRFDDAAQTDPTSGFDDPSGEDNRIFNEGEPLADRGHRFVFHPRVSYPLRLWDRFELVPEVGYREILYTTRAQNFAEQGHVTAQVDLRTRLVGFPGGVSRTHVIEPFIRWAMVGNASSSGAPLFVPATAYPQHRLRQGEFDNLLADPSDRVNSRQTVAVGVENRLYKGGKLVGSLNVSLDRHLVGKGTKYSVNQRDDDFSRFVVRGESHRLYRTTSAFNLTLDPKDAKVEEGLFFAAIAPWSWVSLRASYRYRAPVAARTARFFTQINDSPWDEKTKALSQVRPGATLQLWQNLKLRYTASYDLEEDRLLRQQGTVEYRSKCNCWALGLDIQKQRSGEIRYQLRYSLLGGGDDSLRTNAFANTGALSED
ncbi:MAG: lipopolysaccharide assembly outer membrane protein LptD (OstA) [Myxococcota bacterium]